MKKYFFIISLISVLTTTLQAQRKDFSINQIGFSYHLGVGFHNFSDFNNQIKEYDFVPLDDYCISGGAGIVFGNPKLLWEITGTFSANILTEFDNQKYVNYFTTRLVGRLMQTILHQHTFRSRIYIGGAGSIVNLSFVDGTQQGVRPQSFNQFIGTNAVSHLQLPEPQTDVNIGFIFEYVPDWFIANKDYRKEFINIGFDVGYMHNFRKPDGWVMRGVRTPNNVSNVPELNTNHFYLYLTYRFLFDILMKKKKSS